MNRPNQTHRALSAPHQARLQALHERLSLSSLQSTVGVNAYTIARAKAGALLRREIASALEHGIDRLWAQRSAA